MKINKDKGYTLLFSMLLTSLILAIGVSILGISRKELALSTSSRDSQTALFAADAGMDCALYLDTKGTFATSTLFGAPGAFAPRKSDEPGIALWNNLKQQSTPFKAFASGSPTPTPPPPTPTPVPSFPDLTAAAATPSSATVGTALTFSALISNIGAAATGATFNNLFQVATGAGGAGTVSAISVNAAGALGIGGSANVTSSNYTFPSSGTYSVRACADNDASFSGAISESDETNNCGAWTNVAVAPAPTPTPTATPTATPVPSLPDLVAGSVTPSTATAGASTLFSSLVSNSGNASTGSGFQNFFQVATAAGGGGSRSDLFSVAVSPLGIGASAGITSSYTFGSAGTYSIRACADQSSSLDTGTISESAEGNNCSGWTDVAVASAPTPTPTPVPSQPDLTAAAPSPATATAGTSLTFSSVVSNIGNASTVNNFNNLFQLATAANGGGSVSTLSIITGGPLGIGANTTVTTGTYTFASAGTYSVRTCADNDSSFLGGISESNEGNNCSAWTNVTVAAAATPTPTASPSSTPVPTVDLTAAAPTPAVATVSAPLTFSSVISNTGGATTASNFNNLFQVATAANGGGSISVISVNVGGTLGGGSTETVTSASYTFGSSGTYSVRTCADNDSSFAGVVAESNEGNNCSGWTNVSVAAAGSPTPTPTATPTATPTPTATAVPTPTPSSSASPSPSPSGSASPSPSPTASPTATPVPTPIPAPPSGYFYNLFQIATSTNGTGKIIDVAPVLHTVMSDGTSGSVSALYTFPAPGNYSVRLCVDMKATGDTGTIAESNETDNCGAWTNITVATGTQSRATNLSNTPLMAEGIRGYVPRASGNFFSVAVAEAQTVTNYIGGSTTVSPSTPDTVSQTRISGTLNKAGTAPAHTYAPAPSGSASVSPSGSPLNKPVAYCNAKVAQTSVLPVNITPGYTGPVTYFYDYSLGSSTADPCVTVKVTKEYVAGLPQTTIESYGHNNCQDTGARRVERAIRVTY